MSLSVCAIIVLSDFLAISPAINPVFSRGCREFEIAYQNKKRGQAYEPEKIQFIIPGYKGTIPDLK